MLFLAAAPSSQRYCYRSSDRSECCDGGRTHSLGGCRCAAARAQRSQSNNERILLVETWPGFVNQPRTRVTVCCCLLVPYNASYGVPRKTHIYAAVGIKREEAIGCVGRRRSHERVATGSSMNRRDGVHCRNSPRFQCCSRARRRAVNKTRQTDTAPYVSNSYRVTHQIALCKQEENAGISSVLQAARFAELKCRGGGPRESSAGPRGTPAVATYRITAH